MNGFWGQSSSELRFVRYTTYVAARLAYGVFSGRQARIIFGHVLGLASHCCSWSGFTLLKPSELHAPCQARFYPPHDLGTPLIQKAGLLLTNLL